MPSFRERYCSKHNIIYYDSMCPQCREDEEKKQFETIIGPLKKAEQKREAQEQLRLILAKLEKATLVKETTRYKRSVCPYCGHPSLFFSNVTGYECHNKACGLTSSIRYYTEKSNR
jgi:RNA polymerase subunit RPABC4/transcription elongation factor Spt4